jgi:hypothetical protein
MARRIPPQRLSGSPRQLSRKHNTKHSLPGNKIKLQGMVAEGCTHRLVTPPPDLPVTEAPVLPPLVAVCVRWAVDILVFFCFKKKQSRKSTPRVGVEQTPA